MRRLTLVALALVALTGCPRGPAPADGGASEPTKGAAVTIQLNWLPEPQFGGIYAAHSEGVFAEHGLDVTVRKGGPDVPAVQMAASGQVDFAIAAADEVFRIREGGADVVAIFATYQTAPQGLMTHARRGVDSLEALLKAKGTLAVQPGLAYVEFLKTRYGMEGVELVTYQGGIAQLVATKEEGDFAQQCFVTSEPIAAKREGLETKAFLIADSGFNPYTSVVITRRETLSEHPERVRAMVAALREGWTRYLADPGPANSVMQELNPSMDAETFKAAAEAQVDLIRTADTQAQGLGVMSLERWTQLGEQLKQVGTVEGKVDPRDCFIVLE